MKPGMHIHRVRETLGGSIMTDTGLAIEGSAGPGDVVASQWTGNRFSAVGVMPLRRDMEAEKPAESPRLEDRRKKKRRIVIAGEIEFERKPVSLAFSSMTHELADVLAGVVCTSSFHRQPAYEHYGVPRTLSPAPGYDRFGVLVDIEYSAPIESYANPDFCSTVMTDPRVRSSAVAKVASATFDYHFGSLSYQGVSLFEIYGLYSANYMPGWSGWVLTGPKWAWSIVTASIKAVWDFFISKWNSGIYDGLRRELSLEGRMRLLKDALAKGEADDTVFEIPEELYPELGDNVDVWITRRLYDPYFTPDFVGRLKPDGRGAEIDAWEVSYDQSNTTWEYIQRGLGTLRLTKTMSAGRYHMVIHADFRREDLVYSIGETIVRIRYGQWVSP